MQVEGPVETEDDSGSHRILERGSVKTAHSRHHYVVEILLAATIPLHRVEAKFEESYVVLPVRTGDRLVDGPLDGERARLDQFCPLEHRQVVLEGFHFVRVGCDEVHELPVILRGKAYPLGVRHPPHYGRV